MKSTAYDMAAGSLRIGTKPARLTRSRLITLPDHDIIYSAAAPAHSPRP